ncbi:GNAT family N-acetyltransferase [Pseudomonas allokribbensis]|uniref:GNAT family N-acetyltransferase n=1 Tax=Pseudomonas allokribbensis TaxID=2774460 RepID=UPI0017887BD6|nr:GNAT family N-acetyltransferase [Pseudomonas allokribbensis]
MSLTPITLRAIEISDIEVVTYWLKEPRVAEELSWHFPLTFEGTKAFFDMLASDQRNKGFAIENEAGGLVGLTMLYGINDNSREAWTGTLIAPGNSRRRGYAKASRLLLAEHAFGELNLKRLLSKISRSNIAAEKFLLSLPYSEIVETDESYDFKIFELTRSAWRQSNHPI